jgi:hypothetical protein
MNVDFAGHKHLLAAEKRRTLQINTAPRRSFGLLGWKVPQVLADRPSRATIRRLLKRHPSQGIQISWYELLIATPEATSRGPPVRRPRSSKSWESSQSWKKVQRGLLRCPWMGRWFPRGNFGASPPSKKSFQRLLLHSAERYRLEQLCLSTGCFGTAIEAFEVESPPGSGGKTARTPWK